MSKKQTLIALCIVVLTTSVFASDKPTQFAKQLFGLASYTQTTEQQNSGNPELQPKVVSDSSTQASSIAEMQNNNNSAPDHVVYDVLFNMVRMLDREAAKLESQGKSGKIWSEYFERQGRLSPEQATVLRQVADEFAAEIEPNRARAMQIIAERRAAFPNGQISEGEQPPAPSDELITLQQQRQEIALRHRDRLQTLLGKEAFELFGRRLQQNFTNNMLSSNDIHLSLVERANRFAESANQTLSAQQKGGQEK